MRGRTRSSFTISMPSADAAGAISICDRGVPGGARRSRTDDILLAKQALYQLSYGPVPGTVRSPGELSAIVVAGPARLVGPGRLELPTLRLSGVRSNHLSYGPMAARQPGGSPGSRSHPRRRRPNARRPRRRKRKEKRRRRRPAFYWSSNRQSRERRPGGTSLERR